MEHFLNVSDMNYNAGFQRQLRKASREDKKDVIAILVVIFEWVMMLFLSAYAVLTLLPAWCFPVFLLFVSFTGGCIRRLARPSTHSNLKYGHKHLYN